MPFSLRKCAHQSIHISAGHGGIRIGIPWADGLYIIPPEFFLGISQDLHPVAAVWNTYSATHVTL